MATIIATEGASPVEPGLWIGFLVGVEQSEGLFGNGWKWVFNLADEQGEQLLVEEGESAGTLYEFYVFTSDKFSRKSNMRKLVSALLGREIKNGESLEVEDLVGNRCLLVVERNDEGNPRASSFMPYRGPIWSGDSGNALSA